MPPEDFPQSFDVSLMAADGFFGPRKHPECLEKSSLVCHDRRSRENSRRELRTGEDVNSLHCDETAQALNTAKDMCDDLS